MLVTAILRIFVLVDGHHTLAEKWGTGIILRDKTNKTQA
jgi:hypothetical protein